MILLFAHILILSAQAQFVTQNAGTYCVETQPQAIAAPAPTEATTLSEAPPNNIPLSIALSITSTTTCDNEQRSRPYCSESVQCAVLPPDADAVARSLHSNRADKKDFEHSSQEDKVRVMKRMRRYLQWLAFTVVCPKVKNPKDSNDPKLYCPDPDQCKFPQQNLAIEVGEFLPGTIEAMTAREKNDSSIIFKKPDLYVAPAPPIDKGQTSKTTLPGN